MANYIKSTNFTSKDALVSGNPLKIVKGAEFDVEFNAIATAVASKADTASPEFTGTPIAPTPGGTATNGQIATVGYVTAALQAVYPVGSVYINATNSTNPATLLGFGVWTAFGAGRVPVGFDSSDTLFNAAEKTGGSKDAIVVSHSHTATSTSTVTDPGHRHNYYSVLGGSSQTKQYTDYDGNSNAQTSLAYTGITVATNTTVASAGSSGTNANVQPYITVYMWKRTS